MNTINTQPKAVKEVVPSASQAGANVQQSPIPVNVSSLPLIDPCGSEDPVFMSDMSFAYRVVSNNMQIVDALKKIVQSGDEVALAAFKKQYENNWNIPFIIDGANNESTLHALLEIFQAEKR